MATFVIKTIQLLLYYCRLWKWKQVIKVVCKGLYVDGLIFPLPMLKDGQQSPKLAFTRHHLVSFSMCLEVVSLPEEPKLHLDLVQFHRASFASSCKALHHPALRTPGVSLKTARQPGTAVCTSALQHPLDTVHGWDQQRMQTPSLVKVQCGCAVLGRQQIGPNQTLILLPLHSLRDGQMRMYSYRDTCISATQLQ